MRYFLYISVIWLFTTITGHELYAQAYSFAPFATVSGTQANEQLGTVLRKAQINTSGAPHLFIGAPGASKSVFTNHGRIYLLPLPVESDTVLSSNHIIIEGLEKDDQIGRFFNVGDFNGDGNVDVVTWHPEKNNDAGRVLVFYGPFNSNSVRTPENANITLNGIAKDAIGAALSVIPPENGSFKNGILIGASGNEGFTGIAYYIKDVTTLAPISTLTTADVIFKGEIIFDLFGETLQNIGDINGDNEIDFAISSVKHSNNKSLQGATYIFFGPFTKSVYLTSDAAITIFGRNASTLWSGRIFRNGDLNKDGFNDFTIGSDGDGNGTLALFYGRANWADSIYVGEVKNAGSQHSILTNTSASGFGYSLDFSGDYNFDGVADYIYGAPYTSSKNGGLFVSNNAGSGITQIVGGTTSAEGQLGTQVVQLGNINTKAVDEFGVDDFVTSAPNAFATAKFNSIKSGVLTFFTGKLNPPNSALSVTGGTTISIIGDSARVRITSTKGSKPIVRNHLRMMYAERGESTRIDSIDFPVNTTNVSDKWFKLNKSGTITLYHQVIDNVGIVATSSYTLYFGGVPAAFNLQTEFAQATEIKGDRTTLVKFESEASADTNGASIKYELLFSTDEVAFNQGSGFTIIKSGASPKFSLTYQELNTYLINNGYLNLNITNTFYWSIRARNQSGSIPLFSRYATNGPRTFPFIRKGLDPFFQLTTGGDRNLLIEGLASDMFEFKWTSLISENPNAIIDYRFVLLKDTTAAGKKSPVISVYTNPSLNNTYQITFADLEFILKENEVFDKAKSDTVKWFYTIEAILDGQEDNPWFVSQRYRKANIQYVVVVSNEKETKEEFPTDFELYPNYPNPFNPTTQLKFAIPEASHVKIMVFNLLGQSVYTWQSNGELRAGFHEHVINAQDWSSGIYIYQIQVGTERLTGKMSLVK